MASSIKKSFTGKNIIWNSVRSVSFVSMMECHEYFLKKSDLSILKEYFDVDSLKVAKDHKTLIKYIEKKYKCSGVCKKALFFYSVELDQGRPMLTCGDTLLKAFNPYIASFGIILIITAVFLLFTCKATSFIFCFFHEKKINKKLT